VKKKGKLGDIVDLDASAILLDGDGNVLEAVSFQNLSSSNQSVVHSGDKTTEGGDHEQITVYLSYLQDNVESVIFAVNSYTNTPFSYVERAYVRLVESGTGYELVFFDINSSGNHTGLIMCGVYRDKKERSNWIVKAIGSFGHGTVYTHMLSDIRKYARQPILNVSRDNNNLRRIRKTAPNRQATVSTHYPHNYFKARSQGGWGGVILSFFLLFLIITLGVYFTFHDRFAERFSITARS